MGGGSVKADQVPRDKLRRAIKIASICFGQAGENIALFCPIGDDVHPYRTNCCDSPISSRARQLNRDIAEVSRASDKNVADQIGALFRQEGASKRLVYGPKVPLWRSRRKPNR